MNPSRSKDLLTYLVYPLKDNASLDYSHVCSAVGARGCQVDAQAEFKPLDSLNISKFNIHDTNEANINKLTTVDANSLYAFVKNLPDHINTVELTIKNFRGCEYALYSTLFKSLALLMTKPLTLELS